MPAPAPPLHEDLLHDGELPYAEFIEIQIAAGSTRSPSSLCLTSTATGLGRIAETAVAWFQSEVVLPTLAAGKRPDEIFGLELAHRLNVLKDAP